MAIVIEPVVHYFPLSSGQYVIKPGFYRLGHDFGNGAADRRLFQLDRQFADYRQAKHAARAENPDKYICIDPDGHRLEPELNRFLIRQLIAEYPGYFRLHQTSNRQQLDCLLSGDTLQFTDAGQYLGCRPGDETLAMSYAGGLDALAMQIQEDLALIWLSGEENRLCAIHLCQPNHWDPRDKIGRDFIQIHAPVPGMERINTHALQLLQACLQQGPFVRFAWGIATDERLNHHPEPPGRVAPELWQGREFDAANPAAWLRVERQTLYGLQSINAVLFGIRTYHYPVATLSATEQCLLSQALETMPTASQHYKGLAGRQRDLLHWLHNLCDAS